MLNLASSSDAKTPINCCPEKWAGHECHCACEKKLTKWKALAGELLEALEKALPHIKAITQSLEESGFGGPTEADLTENFLEEKIAKAREARL